jgi:hypothetical protein
MVSPTADLEATRRSAWDLFVFRKNRDLLPTRRLVGELCAEIQRGTDGFVIDALIRAGEIETGLADEAYPASDRMAQSVDQLATIACGAFSSSSSSVAQCSVLATLERLGDLPSHIRCAHPEGFSYYGLHPLDFADLISKVHSQLKPRAAVIGIRSVGSTLGAVVTAALRARGMTAERTTVRPAGEPYERQVAFAPAQLRWMQSALEKNADFLVVDEGPGFSGSTFLSVARALRAAGVPQSRIVLLCSRPFPAHLEHSELEREWRGFRSYRIEYGQRVPRTAGQSLGGGAWRHLLFVDRAHWPPCWTDQERIKHLSTDGKTFFKFEGFGRYGHRVRQQAAELAQAGFSPLLNGYVDGYARYEFVRGRPLSQRDLSRALLERMAAYCAFRASTFTAEQTNPALLNDMLRVNLGIEFGMHDFKLEIPVERPVYPDCRMLPHEWLVAPGGKTLKTDCVSHGEGHQLPGPADIAWDLAGTIVEWQLPAAAIDHFLASYRRQSGDDPIARMPHYLLLYRVLRMAQCHMGRAAMGNSVDSLLLRRHYIYLQSKVKEMLNGSPLASPQVLKLQ